MYNINYDKIVSIKDKLTKINIEKLLEINNNFLNIFIILMMLLFLRM